MCILALIQDVHLEHISLTDERWTRGYKDIAKSKILAQGCPSLLCQSKVYGESAAKPPELICEEEEEGREVEAGIR